MTNNANITALIAQICESDTELRDALLVALLNTVTENAEPETVWYDAFKSESTTVQVKATTVQVKVKRGHANEWHDRLRAAGFRWSRKGFWWAHLDDGKRAEVAAHNAEIDAQTAGMTSEQRRTYWAERRTRKTA